MSASGISVFKLFNECQQSTNVHAKCAKLVWKLFSRDKTSEIYNNITECMCHVLVVSQVGVLATFRQIAAFR